MFQSQWNQNTTNFAKPDKEVKDSGISVPSQNFGSIMPITKKFNHDNNLPGQTSSNPNDDPSIYVGQLERQLGDQRVEATNLRKNLLDLEGRHQDMSTQYNMLSTEFGNLRREYDSLMKVKNELYATQCEQERSKQDKDFHHEQHLTLRRELLAQLNKDFENDQLKREKSFTEDELKATREKSHVLEKQIEELLVFANKPKEDGDGGREFYFARKIVQLEDSLKNIMSEKDQLAFDNKKLKEGIRDLDLQDANRTLNNDSFEEKNPNHFANNNRLNDTRIEVYFFLII